MQDKEKRAAEVYEQLCVMLDKMDFHYSKEGKDKDGDYVILFSFTGDDLPMQFVMFMDVDRQLIRLMSKMPFAFSEEKRVDGAVVVSRANYRMVDGNFDYNFQTVEIIFKVTTSFLDSIIGEELFRYMIGFGVSMVDEFNDKFLAVDKGAMSVAEFLAKY